MIYPSLSYRLCSRLSHLIQPSSRSHVLPASILAIHVLEPSFLHGLLPCYFRPDCMQYHSPALRSPASPSLLAATIVVVQLTSCTSREEEKIVVKETRHPRGWRERERERVDLGSYSSSSLAPASSSRSGHSVCFTRIQSLSLSPSASSFPPVSSSHKPRTRLTTCPHSCCCSRIEAGRLVDF